MSVSYEGLEGADRARHDPIERHTVITGRRAFVVGVGMTKFEKPGSRPGWDYPLMVKEAGEAALTDAGVDFSQIQEVYAGYVYGDSTSGERAVYELGMTGVPVINVNNNCSTGSTALYLAARTIRGGLVDCALAVGFEKMNPGSLATVFDDRVEPIGRHWEALARIADQEGPPAPWMFGAAGAEHMRMYGSAPEHFARIAQKNHRHSADNPNSQFQDVYSLEEILTSRTIYAPAALTKLQCSPTSDGAAAAVVVSEEFVDRYDLAARAVEIVGQAMVTDMPSTFESRLARDIVGASMSRVAAEMVYAQADLGPDDVDVIELHDCFSPNELITYEALGLAREGEGHLLVESGDNDYGGRWVVNPSGGLISKGHPLGATGLAQCAELVWQLRGQAGRRQVPGAKVALQHNLGLGGAAVVTAYRPADRA
jgi:acetyl-CoA acyltransferase